MVALKNISIYKPFDFKNQFIEVCPQQTDLKECVNDFFIHLLDNKKLRLKLPFPPHRKTVHDFIFVTHGYAVRHQGITSYKIANNEVMGVPKLNISTTDYYTEDICGFYCHFSDAFLASNALLLDWQSGYTEYPKMILSLEVSERLQSLLTVISRLYYSDWLNSKGLIAQYLRTVISEMVHGFPSKSAGTDRNRDLVSSYIHLINENLDRGLQISEYANMLNVSPNHLNKRIKTQLGLSALAIYNEMVLQEAKVLLLQTSKDIGEIAFALGYNDPSYFSKFFKKMTQQTPLEYRKMIEMYQ